MTWEAESDSFRYTCKFAPSGEFFEHLKLAKEPQWTKRLILRLSATVYNPLRLISPFTVRSRSILQPLWQEELDWDTPIPEEFVKWWNEWLEELFEIALICTFPRHLQFRKIFSIELHVFADASTKVFATCVYVRVTTRPKNEEKIKRRTSREENREEEKVVYVSLVKVKAREIGRASCRERV